MNDYPRNDNVQWKGGNNVKHPSPFSRKKGERVMRRYLTPGKALRRFAGVAVAAGTVAAIGLAPAASAQVATPGTTGSAAASAVTAPRSSTCHWEPTPPALWVGDPAASYPIVWGNYNRPGQSGVAYKVTGQFAHSTTMVFTSYNDLMEIPSPAYTINDSKIIPDPGSVNPFVPGTRVMGKPRNYTAWFWPDSVPVPAGLKNVVLYATKPAIAGATAARWSLTMRLYHMQPGYRAVAALPTITAVSAADPSKPVRCPLTVRGTYKSQLRGIFAHLKKFGRLVPAPEPTTGNRVYFTRYPGEYSIGADGVSSNGCINYFVGEVPVNQISVITEHLVAPYFNNNLVTPLTIMKDWPIRYQSLSVGYFTLNVKLYATTSLNTDNAVYQPDGSWVTIFLPSQPRLTAEQIRLVRAAARALHYNVIQIPPPATGLGKLIPEGLLYLRQKAISPSFPYSNLNVPCYAQHHNYKNYTHQTSPAFFAKYASNPGNNGPYYIDGVKLTFPQFMAQFSRK
jgi:hypothetical protein